jgi:REP element-mobilizing transposase RayT
MAHILFRCHDRNHFLQPLEVKRFALSLLARYKYRYGVKIFDFCIMDKHVHLSLSAPTADALGNFMRTVESQLARFMNKFFNCDSQALKERYKSIVVVGVEYTSKLTQYIVHDKKFFAIQKFHNMRLSRASSELALSKRSNYRRL